MCECDDSVEECMNILSIFSTNISKEIYREVDTCMQHDYVSHVFIFIIVERRLSGIFYALFIVYSCIVDLNLKISFFDLLSDFSAFF